MFKKATKEKSKLRILFEGASGSGKTYSSLVLASGFNEKIAVVSLLIMSLSDPFASLSGSYFGKLKIYQVKRDWENYSGLFSAMSSFLKKPDLVIYLKASTDTLLKRIKSRRNGSTN